MLHSGKNSAHHLIREPLCGPAKCIILVLIFINIIIITLDKFYQNALKMYICIAFLIVLMAQKFIYINHSSLLNFFQKSQNGSVTLNSFTQAWLA